MTIGIDLDSVLAYLEEPMVAFLNQNYGTNHKITDMSEYDMSVLWKCTHEEMVDRIYKFYKSPFMDKVTPVKGAIKGVAQLKKKHDLVVITSRPIWLENKTLEWLADYFPNQSAQIVLTNQFSRNGESKVKKSDICKRYNAELLIDDCLEYCEDCTQNGIPAYLFNRPWNVTSPLPEKALRVKGWSELVRLLA